MPEKLTPQDQLQPALLDRLTDEEPDKKLEPRMQRVISKRRLREAVLRDLAWLFNTTRLDANMDAATLPNARRSVINFGLPALSGQTASTIEVPTSSGRSARRSSISSRASCRRRCACARSRPLASTTTTSSAWRFPVSSGRSPFPSNCWCGPRSTSRPARSSRGPRADAGVVNGSAAPPVLRAGAGASPRNGRRVCAGVPQDRRPPRHERARGCRSVRGAAARRHGVSRRPRAAEARLRVPAVHTVSSRDRLSPLSRADAVDARGADASGQGRPGSGRRHANRAARHDVALDRRPGRCHGVRVPDRARRHASAARGGIGELLLVSPRTCR